VYGKIFLKNSDNYKDNKDKSSIIDIRLSNEDDISRYYRGK